MSPSPARHLSLVKPSAPGADGRAPAAPEPQPDDELIGQTLGGRFRVVEPLGAGGMGRVYRGVQVTLDRPVALKVLNKSYGTGRDEAFRKRFFLEAALTARLRHPNTVTVIDYGCTPDGIFYIAMEYLEGETLSQVLSHTLALPWKRVLGIGQQICRSLREAHNLGVVHRDLKPANVMLLHADKDQNHDLVKVLDFGLVKSFIQGRGGFPGESITKQGMLMGSPQYMAPEQAEKNQADPRSDIYSLGVLLYEMLVGRPPFLGKSHVDVMLKHIHERPPPLQAPREDLPIPEPVSALVMRCLEKDPAKRFQSMNAVLAELQRASNQAGEAIAASGGVSSPAPGGSWSRFVPAALFLAAVGTGLVAVKVLQPPAPAVEATEAPAPATTALLPPPPAVATAVTSPAVAPAPPVPARAKAPIEFHLQSQPSGARVSMKGKPLGVTPLTFTLPSDADGNARAELELTLPGHHPLSMVASGPGPRIELSQKLQPLRRKARATRSRSTRAPTPAAAASATVEEPAARLGDDDVSEPPELAAPPTLPPPAPDEPALKEPELP